MTFEGIILHNYHLIRYKGSEIIQLNYLFDYSGIVLQCIVFYDVILTTSPLDRPIIAEFTRGFP